MFAMSRLTAENAQSRRSSFGRGCDHRSGAYNRASPVLGFVNASIVELYGNTVHQGAFMDTMSVNKFRDNLKSAVEQVVSRHEPLKVTRRGGEAFVVISADDWEREQETLHVLQSKNLMQQILSGYHKKIV